MANNHVGVVVLEFANDSFYKINGAVLSAGAANRNCQIITVVCYIFGYAIAQKADDIGIHDLGNILPDKKFPHGRIFPIQRASFWLPIRIGEAADVKHELSIEGYPMLESE